MNEQMWAAIDRLLNEHPEAAAAAGLTEAVAGADDQRGHARRLKLRGTVHMGYARSSTDGDSVTLRVTDKASGTLAIEVEVAGGKDAASFIFGRGDVPCVFETAGRYVGMKYEHKSEVVAVPREVHFGAAKMKRGMLSYAGVDAVVAPFECDGWRARRDDVTNHHNAVQADECRKLGLEPPPEGVQLVRVVFVRWVPLPADDTQFRVA